MRTVIPDAVKREIDHICHDYKRRIHRGDLEKIARMAIREARRPASLPFAIASGVMGTELGDWIISENFRKMEAT